MNEPSLPDPLDAFLKTPPAAPPPPDVQEMLYRQTASLLPRRQSWLRWGVACGIPCGVAAGILIAMIAAYFLLWSV
jgi:hypothetical protein